MKAAGPLSGMLSVQPAAADAHDRHMPDLAARQVGPVWAAGGKSALYVPPPDIFPRQLLQPMPYSEAIEPRVRQDVRDVTDIKMTSDADHTAHTAQLLLGNPPQLQKLVIDTGSSETWVPRKDSPYCSSSGCPVGSYDDGGSNTFKMLAEGNFSASYMDGSLVAGDYIQDKMTISGQTFDAVFGQVQTGNLSSSFYGGVLGLGPSNGNGWQQPEDNSLLEAMKANNLIKRAVYGITLPQQDSPDDYSFTFGGIDTAKFVAPLQGSPFAFSDSVSAKLDQIIAFRPGPSTLKLDDGNLLLSQSFNVLLDTGSTFTWLPRDVLDAIVATYGGKEENGQYLVPSEAATDNNILRFELGNVSIAVPMADFVDMKNTVPERGLRLAAVNTRWEDELARSDDDASAWSDSKSWSDVEFKEHTWDDTDTEDAYSNDKSQTGTVWSDASDKEDSESRDAAAAPHVWADAIDKQAGSDDESKSAAQRTDAPKKDEDTSESESKSDSGNVWTDAAYKGNDDPESKRETGPSEPWSDIPENNEGPPQEELEAAETWSDASEKDKPESGESWSDEPAKDMPELDESWSDETAKDEPKSDESSSDEARKDKPAADNSWSDEAAKDKPEADESWSDETAKDKPEADKSWSEASDKGETPSAEVSDGNEVWSDNTSEQPPDKEDDDDKPSFDKADDSANTAQHSNDKEDDVRPSFDEGDESTNTGQYPYSKQNGHPKGQPTQSKGKDHSYPEETSSKKPALPPKTSKVAETSFFPQSTHAPQPTKEPETRTKTQTEMRTQTWTQTRTDWKTNTLTWKYTFTHNHTWTAYQNCTATGTAGPSTGTSSPWTQQGHAQLAHANEKIWYPLLARVAERDSILGASFLTSAYMFVDIEARRVYLGQAVNGASQSEIRSIPFADSKEEQGLFYPPIDYGDSRKLAQQQVEQYIGSDDEQKALPMGIDSDLMWTSTRTSAATTLDTTEAVVLSGTSALSTETASAEPTSTESEHKGSNATRYGAVLSSALMIVVSVAMFVGL